MNPPIVTAPIPTRPITGCPCGCTSRPGTWDDPDCVRNRPRIRRMIRDARVALAAARAANDALKASER